MNYEIVHLNEMKIVGQSIRTTNQDGKAAKDIGDMWTSFFTNDLYGTIKNKSNQKTIGLYYDYESDATAPYTFMTGCEVTSGDDNTLSYVEIPPSKYAKFSINGDIMVEVVKVWQYIWRLDLKRTYTFDFEIYHNDGQTPQIQTVDIYIAIE